MEYWLSGGVMAIIGVVLMMIIKPMRRDLGKLDGRVGDHESRIAVLQQIAEAHKEFRKDVKNNFEVVLGKIDDINGFLRNGQ